MALWDDRRVIVCLGTGGVGKTTVAATLAVAAAASGKKALVMTIDPARRLAQALGLVDQGNVHHAVDPARLAELGVALTGSLHVMMPDVKSTFDTLIQRWAPDAQAAERILGNPIYQHFSSALAGSHEYAAVEQLYEVYTSGAYDLIVLDTPPSQNAIDFLEAPGRILDFLDNETLQWLMKPTLLAGKMSLRLLDWGGNALIKALGRVAGTETLQALIEFLSGFQGMMEGFRERSRRVKNLLASPELAFVLVTAPQPNQQRAMLRFRDELAAAGLRVRGAIVNRVRPVPVAADQQAALEAHVEELLGSAEAALRDGAVQALAEEALLAARDQRLVQELRQQIDVPVTALEELAQDAHDLASLALLHRSFL